MCRLVAGFPRAPNVQQQALSRGGAQIRFGTLPNSPRHTPPGKDLATLTLFVRQCPAVVDLRPTGRKAIPRSIAPVPL